MMLPKGIGHNALTIYFRRHTPFLIYSSSGPSAKRQRLIAESQNISDVVDSVSPKDTETQQQTSVDEILIISDVVRSVSPKHTDTQAKGYAPEEVTNTAKRRRRDVAKYVMTRSGEFLVRYNRIIPSLYLFCNDSTRPLFIVLP